MVCTRCQRPTTSGAACARCDEETFGPVPSPTSLYRQAAPPPAATRDPAEPAWLRDPTQHVRSAAPANLIVGIATLSFGLGLTLLSYVGVFGHSGRRYSLYLGLIVFGAYRFVRGLIMRD
jgi:hypothetical protein